jgi:hypothetical protein
VKYCITEPAVARQDVLPKADFTALAVGATQGKRPPAN